MTVNNVSLYSPHVEDRTLILDVTVADAALATPSPEFARAVIEAYGLGVAAIAVRAQAFCSPYFSVHDDDWRSRIPRAWRVEIDLASPPTAAALSRLPFQRSLGISCDDDSLTWEPPTWNDLPVVVIGDFPLGNFEVIAPPLDDPSWQGIRVERLDLHALVQQGRFHLGALRMPEEEERVRAVESRIAPLASLRPHLDLPRSRIARARD